MDAQILATKLFAPPLPPDAVVRPRLLERLDAGANRKLVLLCAPAGFGKTTLVRTWLTNSDEAMAWVSLDEGDADPTRFLAHVVAALRGAVPGVGEAAIRDLAGPAPPPHAVVLTGLLNELVTLDAPVTLVLDDAHAAESHAVDELVTLLLERSPARMRLVVTTRQDPAWPLARWRVRGQLLELRATDLRFTAAEATAFFAQAEDVTLTGDDVFALVSRTEGWVAGLRLAALSLHGRRDGAAFVRAFAGDHRFVVDYLVDEVLRRQPDATRRFLVRTSVLDRLCGPLCDAVTGNAGGADVLADLERRGLFLVPLDDRRVWYRYHQLFADVVRAYARREAEMPIAELHTRASAWYETEGWAQDAIRHALAGGDHERAGDLIVRVGPEMRRAYQDAQLLDWIRALPGAYVRAHVPLAVEHARVLIGVRAWGEAAERLDDAERALALDAAALVSTEVRRRRAAIATARTFHAQGVGDLEAVQRHAADALAVLADDEVFERATVAALLGLAAWSRGDLVAAHAAFAGSMERMAAAGFRQVASSGTFVVADLLLELGRHRDAEALYAAALADARAHREEVAVGVPNLALGLAELALERGDRAAFDARWAESDPDAAVPIPGTRTRWHRLRARRHLLGGDLDAAAAELDEAVGRVESDALPDVRPAAAERARLDVRRGDLAAADAWSERRQVAAPTDPPTYLRAYELGTWARVRLAHHVRSGDGGPGAQAVEALAALATVAVRQGWPAAALDAQVGLALAHEAVGDRPAARDALDAALAMAEPEGIVRAFVDEGIALAPLLADAAARRVRPAFVARLRDAWGVADTAEEEAPSSVTSVPDDAIGVEPLLEPLTERELAVLRLLAQGLSNADIGRRTFRALPTIKGYNRSLFVKLQARNRTEAVARARALGLI